MAFIAELGFPAQMYRVSSSMLMVFGHKLHGYYYGIPCVLFCDQKIACGANISNKNSNTINKLNSNTT